MDENDNAGVDVGVVLFELRAAAAADERDMASNWETAERYSAAEERLTDDFFFLENMDLVCEEGLRAIGEGILLLLLFYFYFSRSKAKTLPTNACPLDDLSRETR